MESCAECGFDLEGTEKFCPSCGNSISIDYTPDDDEIMLNTTLPILLRFEETIKTNIENPSAIKVVGASLDFYPHYIFEYKIDISKNDPSGKKHNLQNQELVIIDAFNGELLSLYDKSRTKFLNKLNPFLSKGSNDITERNQIINDLRNIKPIMNLKLKPTGDYAINIIDNRKSLVAAEKVILRDIVSRNTVEFTYKQKKAKGKTEERKMLIVPRRQDIKILIRSLVYVPIWVINLKAGDYVYKRKALAASSTIIMDEIALCSKHSSIVKIWNKSKQTTALCEICGGAFCNDHIFKIDQTYYCEEHLPGPPLR